jgi:hypothetical protein
VRFRQPSPWSASKSCECARSLLLVARVCIPDVCGDRRNMCAIIKAIGNYVVNEDVVSRSLSLSLSLLQKNRKIAPGKVKRLPS